MSTEQGLTRWPIVVMSKGTGGIHTLTDFGGLRAIRSLHERYYPLDVLAEFAKTSPGRVTCKEHHQEWGEKNVQVLGEAWGFGWHGDKHQLEGWFDPRSLGAQRQLEAMALTKTLPTLGLSAIWDYTAMILHGKTVVGRIHNLEGVDFIGEGKIPAGGGFFENLDDVQMVGLLEVMTERGDLDDDTARRVELEVGKIGRRVRKAKQSTAVRAGAPGAGKLPSKAQVQRWKVLKARREWADWLEGRHRHKSQKVYRPAEGVRDMTGQFDGPSLAATPTHPEAEAERLRRARGQESEDEHLTIVARIDGPSDG